MTQAASALYTAVGAVLVIAALFAFGLLAERLFVSRREFDLFKKDLDTRMQSLEDRIGRIEQAIDTRFSQLMSRLDLIFKGEGK